MITLTMSGEVCVIKHTSAGKVFLGIGVRQVKSIQVPNQSSREDNSILVQNLQTHASTIPKGTANR